jgi:hypothetical protein
MYVQVSEFEVNVCTCKLTSRETLPSFKAYKDDAGQAGSGANFYAKEATHHIKGDPDKPVDVRFCPLLCLPQKTCSRNEGKIARWRHRILFDSFNLQVSHLL